MYSWLLVVRLVHLYGWLPFEGLPHWILFHRHSDYVTAAAAPERTRARRYSGWLSFLSISLLRRKLIFSRPIQRRARVALTPNPDSKTLVRVWKWSAGTVERNNVHGFVCNWGTRVSWIPSRSIIRGSSLPCANSSNWKSSSQSKQAKKVASSLRLVGN